MSTIPEKIREVIAVMLGRRHLLSQCKKVFSHLRLTDGLLKKKVLFFPMGYFEEAVLWEEVILKALQIRGNDCRSYLCDLRVPICEMRFIDYDRHSICNHCLLCTAALHNVTQVQYFMASKMTNKVGEQDWRALLPSNDINLKAFTYEGIKFGELVRPSLFHYLRTGTDEQTAEFAEQYRKILISALMVYAVQKKILAEYKPNVVVVINGLFYPGAVLIELARLKGIRYVSYERGYILDRLVFSDTSPAVWFPIEEKWVIYKGVALTEAEEKILDDYLLERKYGKRTTIQLWDKPDFDRQGFLTKHRVRQYKRTFTLFTNILWDSAVVGCDEAFESLTEWVTATIDYFASEMPDSLLIVRIHPSEVKIKGQESREKIIDFIYQTYPVLPQNIVVVGPTDQTSSYMIMDISDVILVNTSITGLEAACVGKPVVVVGKTHYKNKGFTIDIHGREDYFPALKRLVNDVLSIDTKVKECARRYAYTFFFRYMIDFPFFKQYSRKKNPVLLGFNSINDLEEGKNKNLDQICSFIIGEGRL